MMPEDAIAQLQYYHHMRQRAIASGARRPTCAPSDVHEHADGEVRQPARPAHTAAHRAAYTRHFVATTTGRPEARPQTRIPPTTSRT